MRGVLFYGRNDIRFSDDVQEPEIKVEDELIVDIAWCGICGSDLHEYLDGPIFFPKEGKGHELSNWKSPQCMGHEFSGIVKKVGPKVTKVKPGDHVVVEATSHCSDRKRFQRNNPRINTAVCSACKMGSTNICHYLGFCGLGVHDGALSERVSVSEEHVVRIPKSLPLDIAALVEPLSVAWHAVRISRFQEGDNALVLGAGPIGLATILALQGHKAGRIVVSEPAKIRRDQAEKLGASSVFNPMDYSSFDEGVGVLKSLSDEKGAGFKFSYDASGVPSTFKTSIDALGPNGMAVNIAIWPDKPVNFKPMDVTLEEKFYTGSMCYTVQDFEEVIDAIDKGLIDIEKCKQLITAKIKLEDTVEKGFLELINNKDVHIKILVSP
ncbi:2,3-butanediol dehydrogenase [Ascoidea rubescens DSM 1968]|uniref:GroES-like protein n=1 Tax=Ascoidea rubescens DSM 1968 TaxID=1344418 RepID=A0A1D2VH44_9ASCO|nr:GroES-like protein [Ascoidea rubescens DSM 1968]ODV60974.1 GroES-like protein [Ascoidea rubescens DSM 1968]